jgi:hypothetical protein
MCVCRELQGLHALVQEAAGTVETILMDFCMQAILLLMYALL